MYRGNDPLFADCLETALRGRQSKSGTEGHQRRRMCGQIREASEGLVSVEESRSSSVSSTSYTSQEGDESTAVVRSLLIPRSRQDEGASKGECLALLSTPFKATLFRSCRTAKL